MSKSFCKREKEISESTTHTQGKKKKKEIYDNIQELIFLWEECLGETHNTKN